MSISLSVVTPIKRSTVCSLITQYKCQTFYYIFKEDTFSDSLTELLKTVIQ